jgi:transcriptional regulator with XRE-family HTH domain
MSAVVSTQLMRAGYFEFRRINLELGRRFICDGFAIYRSCDKLGAQELSMLAKKAPNPTDKHVGSRVRMRRMMLGMSQEKLGDALGLTFQQVQKYEKGTNRIGASRLQQISHILQVPVAFFFEGGPNAQSGRGDGMGEAPSPAYVSDFLATSDGLALTKAFMRIEDSKLRRRIVDLVEQIASREKR